MELVIFATVLLGYILELDMIIYTSRRSGGVRTGDSGIFKDRSGGTAGGGTSNRSGGGASGLST
jgi:hypothetical protein